MNKKGFTLIELLVVIAIIGMLSGIVLVSMTTARKKARDARRQSDIRQIQLAMEMCYDASDCNAAEKYLTSASMPTNIDTDSSPCYLCPVPKDPLGYPYGWIDNTGSDQKYCVYATSEAVANLWYAASPKGVGTTTTHPASLDACW
jgi:type II secretion system protein G